MNPTPRSVLFRADGNAQIGLGHVMRCLALAEMLGPDYARRFAVVQPAPAVAQLIEEKGVIIISIQTDEATEFLNLIDSTDVVVLDGYSFDTDFQRAVRARAKALVYIDDLVTGHQVADVVVNHAGGVTEYDYRSEPYTQFLLGPHYALLRLPFFTPKTPVPQEGPIFVSLGGADPGDTTLRVLRGLANCFRTLKQEWRVHVVVGPVQQNRQAIEAMQTDFKHLKILSSLTAEQMATELLKCQLAITACSTVAYEVCSVGRPLIAIQTAENQKRLASFLRQNELIFITLTGDELLSQFVSAFHVGLTSNQAGFRTRFVQNQRRFFDGQSPERFRALFNRLTA
ncbi:MAG: UDP-2,4-diacetamido-2,4,6-trideoxy-beta-L-altropyranose hydrolase [Cytophagales bacterium]|nr:MAG: UDP-2,4-diacetamido-2,4,6-trideoxy-beta-L-altropyranose hydrolase [Cytophagales bacterium]